MIDEIEKKIVFFLISHGLEKNLLRHWRKKRSDDDHDEIKQKFLHQYLIIDIVRSLLPKKNEWRRNDIDGKDEEDQRLVIIEDQARMCVCVCLNSLYFEYLTILLWRLTGCFYPFVLLLLFPLSFSFFLLSSNCTLSLSIHMMISLL